MAVNWKILLTRPIAFHAPLAIISGSVSAGLMLSQAIYWSTKTKKPDGWFYKTQDDWKEETTLSRREQDSARKLLKERGLIEEDLRGVPATLHYRVLDENVEKALILYSKSLEVSSLAESANLDCTEAPNWIGGNEQTSLAESAKHLLTETTTETTSEITTEIVPIAVWGEYLEMRKKSNKPFTVHAGELIRRKLRRLRDEGHDPVEVLEQSIMNGWTGVFPIKKETRNGESFQEERSRKSAEAISGVLGRFEKASSHLQRALPSADK